MPEIPRPIQPEFTEADQQSEEKLENPSRRIFLRAAARGAMAGAAIGITAGEISRQVMKFLAKPTNMEKARGVEGLGKVLESIANAKDKSVSKYGSKYDRSLREDELVREEFISELGAYIPDLVKNLENLNGREDIITMIVDIMSHFGIQGIFVKELSANGYKQINYSNLANFYEINARDYLPDSAQISDVDIDPRKRGLDENSSLATDTAKLIKEIPGWSSQERQREFKRLADDEMIRSLAAENGLTLAEFFSLVKAMIKFKENQLLENLIKNLPVASDKTICESLLEEQKKFGNRNLISKNTKSFIVFSGYDNPLKNGSKFFDGDKWEKVGEAAGVEKQNFSRFDAVPEVDNTVMVMDLLEKIRESKGESFIAFNAHGTNTELSVDASQIDFSKSFLNEKIRVELIASALVDRVVKAGDENELDNVTLCFGSCLSYEFTNNLINAINRDWETVNLNKNGKLPERSIKPPTIITITQEGSYGFVTLGPDTILMKQLEGIKRDGGVYGKRILKKVQPEAYKLCDYTFFTPDSKNRLVEFAGNQTVQPDSKPV